MDYTVRGKNTALWEGNKYLGKICRNDSEKCFVISLSGLLVGYKFYSTKQLKRYVSKYCCVLVDLSTEIYDYLDSIFVIFKLTN